MLGVVVGVVVAEARPDDERAEQAHPDLLLGVGARLVEERARAVRGERVGRRAVVGRRPRGEARHHPARVELGLRRCPVGQDVLLAGEDDGRRLGQGVVEDDGDLVALVDAQDRTGMLEGVEPARVAPHEHRVAVGQVDVAGAGRQVEDRLAGLVAAGRADDAVARRGGGARGGHLDRGGARQGQDRRHRDGQAAHDGAPHGTSRAVHGSDPPVVRVGLRRHAGGVHADLGRLAPQAVGGREVVRSGERPVVEVVRVVRP